MARIPTDNSAAGLPSAAAADVRPIGVLAGAGALPIEIARELRSQGRAVHVVALEGSAETGTELTSGAHTWTGIGQINRMLGAFRDNGCRELIIAGGVRRPNLRKIRVDAGFFLNLPAILGLMRGGDDRLLRRVIRFFEHHEFVVRGLHDVAPALLADPGAMTILAPDEQLQSDAAVGRAAIAALGHFDVGQAVVVSAGRLIAIEGAEGTDGMLQRLAASSPQIDAETPHGVLVKVPKPGQDPRVDLPAIGPGTVDNARRAGLAGIAVQAGATVVVQRAEVIRAADDAQLPVWGIAAADGLTVGNGDGLDARTASRRDLKVTTVGRHQPRDQELTDCAIGSAVIAMAARFGRARAAIVAREHVLAVAIDEQPGDLVARSRGLRQWGDRDRRRRRRGALVLAASELVDQKLLDAAADAGLGAIYIIGSDHSLDPGVRNAIANVADACTIALLEDV